jgi:predicted deacylase
MTDSPPAWPDVATATRSSFSFPVVVRADGSLVELSGLIVRGSTPWPTLLVTAGVHGDEFEGMAALRHLADALSPLRLQGTLVAVPVANPPAFEAGLRTNPDDRQDMARVFPGDPSGTVTEQLASILSHRLIRHADFYCDLHSAGQYYAMPPLVGYQLQPEPLLTRQRQAARAFGLPLIWGTPGMPGRSLSAAAACGVPALYAEITGEGRCRAADVTQYVRGLERLMGFLGMIDAVPPAPEPRWVVEDSSANAGFLQIQNRAPVGGFYESEVRLLDQVSAGQQLGTIRDALGSVRHTVQAPHPGLVVFLRTFPRVLAGDPLCTILQC